MAKSLLDPGLVKKIAAAGRGTDKHVAHLTKGEVIIPVGYLAKYPNLKRLLEEALKKDKLTLGSQTVGNKGKGTVNPKTGLEEFGYGDGDSSSSGGDSRGGQSDPADSSIGQSLGDTSVGRTGGDFDTSFDSGVGFTGPAADAFGGQLSGKTAADQPTAGFTDPGINFGQGGPNDISRLSFAKNVVDFATALATGRNVGPDPGPSGNPNSTGGDSSLLGTPQAGPSSGGPGQGGSPGTVININTGSSGGTPAGKTPKGPPKRIGELGEDESLLGTPFGLAPKKKTSLLGG